MSSQEIVELNERVKKLEERIKKIEVRDVGFLCNFCNCRKMILLTILKRKLLFVKLVLKVE